MTFMMDAFDEWTFGTGEHPLEQQVRLSLSGVEAWRMYRQTAAPGPMVLSMFPKSLTLSMVFRNAYDMLHAISRVPAHADRDAFAGMIDTRLADIAAQLGDVGVLREHNMTMPLDIIFADTPHDMAGLNKLVTCMMTACHQGMAVAMLTAYAAFWFELCDVAVTATAHGVTT